MTIVDRREIPDDDKENQTQHSKQILQPLFRIGALRVEYTVVSTGPQGGSMMKMIVRIIVILLLVRIYHCGIIM
jgi:hypothetical protein